MKRFAEPSWINKKAIGECAYCGVEIYADDEFYASGGLLICCIEHRNAYIKEHAEEIDIDDFTHWKYGEFSLMAKYEN